MFGNYPLRALWCSFRMCWRVLIMICHICSDNTTWNEVHHGILFDRRLVTNNSGQEWLCIKQVQNSHCYSSLTITLYLNFFSFYEQTFSISEDSICLKWAFMLHLSQSNYAKDSGKTITLIFTNTNNVLTQVYSDGDYCTVGRLSFYLTFMVITKLSDRGNCRTWS